MVDKPIRREHDSVCELYKPAESSDARHDCLSAQGDKTSKT